MFFLSTAHDGLGGPDSVTFETGLRQCGVGGGGFTPQTYSPSHPLPLQPVPFSLSPPPGLMDRIAKVRVDYVRFSAPEALKLSSFLRVLHLNSFCISYLIKSKRNSSIMMK